MSCGWPTGCVYHRSSWERCRNKPHPHTVMVTGRQRKIIDRLVRLIGGRVFDARPEPWW